MRTVYAVVASFALAGAVSAAPLNLLLVTADDMNADSTGFMGSKLGAQDPQFPVFQKKLAAATATNNGPE